MRKRFLDADINNKSWFRKLTAQEKVLWYYISTSCTHDAFWEKDDEAISFYCNGFNGEIPQIIIDKMGRRVPNASNMIYFTINGNGIIYGVGNGDPSCHQSDKGSSRSAFHGKARVIVQSIKDKPGQIKLTANADGLIAKTITIYTVPNQQKITYL